MLDGVRKILPVIRIQAETPRKMLRAPATRPCAMHTCLNAGCCSTPLFFLSTLPFFCSYHPGCSTIYLNATFVDCVIDNFSLIHPHFAVHTCFFFITAFKLFFFDARCCFVNVTSIFDVYFVCPECSIPDVHRYTCNVAQIVGVNHAWPTLSSFFMYELHALACIDEHIIVDPIPLGVPTPPTQRPSSLALNICA